MNQQSQKLNKAIYNCAIRLLASREHSCYELFNKLNHKGFLSDEINEVIEQLQINNLQSDQRFVESFVRSWANKGRGPIKIIYKLKQHHLNEELISCAINIDTIDWLHNTYLVWQKKFNQPALSLKEKAKQFRFLQQRGFVTEHINQVLNKHIL